MPLPNVHLLETSTHDLILELRRRGVVTETSSISSSPNLTQMRDSLIPELEKLSAEDAAKDLGLFLLDNNFLHFESFGSDHKVARLLTVRKDFWYV